MCSDWLISNDWITQTMHENKQHRIQTHVDSILAINALPIPHDIKQGFIISYKYDKLQKKYKRNYANVLRQLIRFTRDQNLLNRRLLRRLRHLPRQEVCLDKHDRLDDYISHSPFLDCAFPCQV